MNFQTPDWVCNIMASTMDDVPEWGEWYLDGGTYTILEPTPGEGNLVNILKRKFPHATIITPEADFLDMPVPE
ncbi:hypothetical protein KAR91_39620, partial [Candidatus Pacearchaeota archaeon]|nr:hypothetical protein [Candidatus Pacearchaeota archaeon]